MSAQRMELGMLWQSYRAAFTRNEYETAASRLHAYLQQQNTKENAAPTALPLSMTHAQEYQLYGIDMLSRAFDEYPSHGWLLSQQPVDLLDNLKQHHMSSIIGQLKAGSGNPESCNRAVVLIQCLCGLISPSNNYVAMVNSGLTSSVLKLAQSCLQMIMSQDAAPPSDGLLTIISYCIIYFHLYYDPNRKWKSQFVRKLSNQPVINVKVSPLDTSLSDFFISKSSNACLMFISIRVVCKCLLWDIIIDDRPNRITTQLTSDIDVAPVYDQSTKVLNLLSGTYPPLCGLPPPHTLHPIE